MFFVRAGHLTSRRVSSPRITRTSMAGVGGLNTSSLLARTNNGDLTVSAARTVWKPARTEEIYANEGEPDMFFHPKIFFVFG